ncbi:MAG TPA: hypothetical protein VEB21_01350, partial [Terriglobales bacterium]|nr:hypothetical protein [Terriglobales bacterium]
MPKLISSGALALHRSIALTALLSLLLAACGDDDDRRRAAQRATRTATQAVATATSTPLATATQTTAATATATTVPTDTAVPTVTNTAVPTVTHTIVPTATATAAATHTATATSSPVPRQPVQILSPSQGIVTLAQAVPVTFRIDESAELASVTATIDGTSLELNRNGAVFDTQAAVAPGERELIIHIDYGDSTDTASVRFEAIALEAPDQCEILNNASCLLPYPSSRFLEPADTPTGFRLSFPAQHMPRQNSRAFPVEPFHRIDGFSPTVPITMHFPGGVDPVQSHAARLRPETRTHDTISLEPDSPTVLIDATTGERVLHFVEPEVRAAREGKPDRETLLMRAAESLKPGHRYLVAMRRLVTHAGTPVVAEPAFAAMRDGRATLIDAIEQRRPAMAGLFDELESHGIERDELVLAFDFVVASDQSLTAEMLKMRDETFAWVAQNQSVQTFAVERVVENECTPGTRIWRRVEGTFQVPLYLSRDPLADPRNPAVFNRDENDMPVASGFTNPPFTFAIPCTILDADNQVYPIILGHGLFGDGRGFVRELAETDQVTDFNYIAGATDWTGLAAPDAGAGGNLPASFVGRVALDQPRAFAALPDRTRQGQLNTLVMARMMKLGMFNLDPA